MAFCIEWQLPTHWGGVLLIESRPQCLFGLRNLAAIVGKYCFFELVLDNVILEPELGYSC
jgi:hypothetical protein